MSGVRARRYLIILAIIAGLVGLYAAVGFLLVPRWTRSELVGLTARDFGRTLSLGDVRFNPFTWTLDLSDFSLPDADGRPMISFGRLEVAVGISSVTHLAPTLSDIVLEVRAFARWYAVTASSISRIWQNLSPSPPKRRRPPRSRSRCSSTGSRSRAAAPATRMIRRPHAFPPRPQPDRLRAPRLQHHGQHGRQLSPHRHHRPGRAARLERGPCAPRRFPSTAR